MKQIDLAKLKLFYEIACDGHMTRTAERLRIPQPSLSRSLNQLEDRIQTKLFDRIPSGMRLTTQGERLYVYAKKVFVEHDAFQRQFFDKEGEIEGEIKIVTTAYLGSEWLTPSLKGFLKRYPKIHIQTLIQSEHIYPAEGDIAICTFIQHQPHLIQKPLFTAYTHLFASEAYLKKFGVPQTVEDLDNHQLITYKGNHYSAYGSTNWILNVGNRPGALPRKSYFDIESLHGMLNSALEGYGIVEFPDYSKVLELGLKRVLPELRGPEINIYYVFPQSRQSSKKITLLYEYLSKQKK